MFPIYTIDNLNCATNLKLSFIVLIFNIFCTLLKANKFYLFVIYSYISFNYYIFFYLKSFFYLLNIEQHIFLSFLTCNTK